MKYHTRAELDAGVEHVRQSPRETGRVVLVVSRPAVGAREMLNEGALDVAYGLLGDYWARRGSDHRKQITVMNARAAELLAGGTDRWALAGDQLFVDFDLSASHLPPGTRIRIGDAVVEVTPPPHRGCHKFTARFGADATAFVNSPVGVELNLRGINAKVVRGGAIRIGDSVTKIASS
jgi:hypothetical protein